MYIRSISKSLEDRDADRARSEEDSLDSEGAQARELTHIKTQSGERNHSNHSNHSGECWMQHQIKP